MSNPLELITVVSSQVGAENWGPLEKQSVLFLTAEPSLQGCKFPLHEGSAASPVIQKTHMCYDNLENLLLGAVVGRLEQRAYPVLRILVLGWFHNS